MIGLQSPLAAPLAILVSVTSRIRMYMLLPFTEQGGAVLRLSGIPGVNPPEANVPPPTTRSVVVTTGIPQRELESVVTARLIVPLNPRLFTEIFAVPEDPAVNDGMRLDDMVKSETVKVTRTEWDRDPLAAKTVTM